VYVLLDISLIHPCTEKDAFDGFILSLLSQDEASYSSYNAPTNSQSITKTAWMFTWF